MYEIPLFILSPNKRVDQGGTLLQSCLTCFFKPGLICSLLFPQDSRLAWLRMASESRVHSNVSFDPLFFLRL